MAIADVLASHRSGDKLRTAARTLVVAGTPGAVPVGALASACGRAPRRRAVHPVRAVMLPLDVMDAEVTTTGEDRSGREFR
ncbi:hypothetical protein [Streptomyces violascens]|uniref:hypothetical protein n=1 Tax=Streptomyces violascens TaxID=67381 RepID=UPI00369632DB